MSNEVRLEALWRDHASAIHAYAVRRTSTPEDAWDVVAEVFLAAWRRIDDVPDGDQARLWLFVTARHVLHNATRSRRRQRDLAARAAAEAVVGEPVPDGSLQPLVRAALDRLSDSDRELVLLTVWDGHSPADAAAVLGLPSGTVRVRLHRARARLRAHLADVGIDTEPDDPAPPAPSRTAALEGS